MHYLRLHPAEQDSGLMWSERFVVLVDVAMLAENGQNIRLLAYAWRFLPRIHVVFYDPTVFLSCEYWSWMVGYRVQFLFAATS